MSQVISLFYLFVFFPSNKFFIISARSELETSNLLCMFRMTKSIIKNKFKMLWFTFVFLLYFVLSPSVTPIRKILFFFLSKWYDLW